MVTSCIATELLPARPAASIKKRFINVISEWAFRIAGYPSAICHAVDVRL
jgi:hypothetical protein